MTQPTEYRTGDQALVREINLSLVMNCLRKHAPISRAALAELTGLNKSTVSSLINELIERQFAHEVGLSSAGVGRPSIQLQPNPNAGYIVSAEIGVDFISVICADFSAEFMWHHKEDMLKSAGQPAILERTLALLRLAVDEGRALRANCGGLLGIAVGVPGLVEARTGLALFVPNLGWENVPVGHTVRQTFPGVPVFVDNEAKLAALGEHFFGAAQGYDDALYISVGAGLGGAIAHDSYLYKGKTGFAGEFGHMTMNPEGERCNCGNRGCWETQVSQAALFRYIRIAVEQGSCSALSDELERLSVSLIVEAAQAGDRVALEALHTVGRYLGIGIASLVNALNPDRVVLGGVLSVAGAFLLPVIESELRQRALRWNANAIQVVLARHGFDACVMGGVATVVQTMLSQPGGA